MCSRLTSVVLAVLFVFSGVPALCAVAPAMPGIGAPGTAEAAPPREPAGPHCVIAGTVYCTEYGSRHNEQLRLVFTNGDKKYVSAISDTNGSFAVTVPCGMGFDLSVEFDGRAMPVGWIELPDSPAGTVFSLEIRHIGSYLELVRDVRNGIYEDDIIYRLVAPEQ